MKLIVGLGNPGTEHEGTRHNAGFLVIDKLLAVSESGTKFDKKTNADIAKATINKKRVLLVKPQTFMNNSGLAVRALLDFYKLKPENLIVIHDDKDIPLGETRVQTDRGPAGHNGIKSIIEHLGTQNFTRIRVGIDVSSPPARGGAGGGGSEDTANFVLGKFTKEEINTLRNVVDNVVKEIEGLV